MGVEKAGVGGWGWCTLGILPCSTVSSSAAAGLFVSVDFARVFVNFGQLVTPCN